MDAQVIQGWLVDHIALLLKVDAAKVDVKQPFLDIAMDSLAAFRLLGDLEDFLGRPLPPTLFYDHDDIEQLARHLASTR